MDTDANEGSNFFKKCNSYKEKIRYLFDSIDSHIITTKKLNNSAGYIKNHLSLGNSNNPISANLSSVIKIGELSKDSELTMLNEEINEEFKGVQQKEKGANMISPNYENKIIDIKGKII